MKPYLLTPISMMILLGGCLGLVDDSPDSSENGNVLSESDIKPLGAFLLSDCVRFGTFMYWPPNSAPDYRPPGWQPTAATTITSIGISAYECNRIGLDHFERGPIRLILMESTNTRYPETCASGEPGGGIIFRIVVDDEQIAEYMVNTWGLPAEHAEITRSQVLDQDASVTQWTWQTRDSTEEFIDFPHGIIGMGSYQETQYQRFWDTGDGVGKMESLVQYQSGIGSDFVATGFVNDLQPLGGSFLWQGISSNAIGLSLTSTLKTYGDYKCSEES